MTCQMLWSYNTRAHVPVKTYTSPFALPHSDHRTQVVRAKETTLSQIREQLLEAQASDKDAMSSTLIVEGEMMSFEIEELKIRLKDREREVSRRGRLRPSR